MNKIGIFILGIAVFFILGTNLISAGVVEQLQGTEHLVKTCVEKWSCGSWSSCNHDDESTRTCYDLNHCGNYEDNKKIERVECDSHYSDCYRYRYYNCYIDRECNNYNNNCENGYRVWDRNKNLVYPCKQNQIVKESQEPQTKIIVVPNQVQSGSNSGWGFDSSSFVWIIFLLVCILIIVIAVLILIIDMRRS